MFINSIIHSFLKLKTARRMLLSRQSWTACLERYIMTSFPQNLKATHSHLHIDLAHQISANHQKTMDVVPILIHYRIPFLTTFIFKKIKPFGFATNRQGLQTLTMSWNWLTAIELPKILAFGRIKTNSCDQLLWVLCNYSPALHTNHKSWILTRYRLHEHSLCEMVS